MLGSAGPRVGEILRALLDKVIDDPSLNTRDKLMPLAEELAGCLDMRGVERILDLGGGSGVISLALLEKHPDLREQLAASYESKRLAALSAQASPGDGGSGTAPVLSSAAEIPDPPSAGSAGANAGSGAT